MRSVRHGLVLVAFLSAACGNREGETAMDLQVLQQGPAGPRQDDLSEVGGGARRAQAKAFLETVHPAGVEAEWSRPLAAPARVRLHGGWRPAGGRATPAATALAFFDSAGLAWGMTAPREELRVTAVVPDELGFTTLKLSQMHRGVPVIGTSLQVSLGRQGEVRTVLGTFASGLELETRPTLQADQARAAALRRGAPGDTVESLVLVVLPAMGDASTEGAARLAWQAEVRTGEPTNDRTVLVDAHDGALLGEAPRTFGLYREVWHPLPLVPLGTLLMNEAGPVGGYVPDADAEAVYNGVRIYDAFLASHGISSFTNANDWYKNVIHSESAASSGGAFFQPDADRTKAYVAFAATGVATPGPALDVVSHEWTHGLLRYTGRLIGDTFVGRSLHEALADGIACLVDRNDWVVGDFFGIRDLRRPGLSDWVSDPGLFHDSYDEFDPADGWYHNSTIFSHAVFLIGDTGLNAHRDSLVGVQGIGRDKAAAILLRAIRLYLFAETDFRAARFGVITACEDLAQAGSSGISDSDCGSVAEAFRAVGIPRYVAPTVRVAQSVPGSLNGCIDEGGTGFPPNTDVKLVFEDVLTGIPARNDTVHTDTTGSFAWWFGLGCPGETATEATTHATALLDRIDPHRVGVTGRPFRYWAEYADGGPRTSNVVSYWLDYTGSCIPTACTGLACGGDGCGGVCGCSGTTVCSAGACVPASAPATTACGTIGTAHWTAASSPVLVTCDVTVTGTLTIDPGVTVMFQSATTDLIVAAGGTLSAIGTADAPILFTSDGEVLPSSWGGIYTVAGAASVTLRHVELRYGGAPYPSGGFPILLNPTVPHAISDVRLVQNRVDAIGLVAGAYSTNLRLNVVGLPYWLRDDLTVNAGVTMTVDPGVVLKMEEYLVYADVHAADIIVNGRLVANGTASQPIIFTSYRDDSVLGDSNADGTTAPAPSDWGGIQIAGDSTQPPSELSNVVIRYAGETTRGAGFPILMPGTTQPLMNAVTLTSNRRNAIGLVAGAYSTNLRLNVVGIPYWLGSDLTVNAGVTMTVDPGVVLKMEEYLVYADVYAADIIVNGRLVANGTASQPIFFTSYRDDAVLGDSNADGATAPAAADWGGIQIAGDSTQPPSELSNVVIRYAGETTRGAGFPILMPGTTQPLMNAVTLTSNRRNAIGLVAGAYSTNLRLNVVGIPYWLGSDLTVNAGVTMTVDPGVVLKMEEYLVYADVYAADIIVNGRLVANGTASQPIFFTSYRDDSVLGDSNADGTTAPAPSDWGGIQIAGDSTQPPSELSNVVIRYAGETTRGAGFPILMPGTTQPLMNAVTLTSNRRNAIGLVAGAYSTNLRLNVVGIPYWLGSDLTVNAGVTMTVDPGVVLKLEEYLVYANVYATDIIVNGRLVANGTASQPIFFTSYRDDSVLGDSNADGATAPAAADWGGIRFESTSTGSLSYVNLAYGGEDSNGATCAVRVTGSAPALDHVVFRSNEDDVCIYAGGQPDLGGGASGSPGENRFEGHVAGSGNWAVYNDSVLDVSARNNWWGITSAAGIDAIIRDCLDVATLGRVLYDGFQDCADDSACSDGNACTQADSCVAGHCQGTAYACAAPGPCETAVGAVCNGDGTCTYPAAVGASCDDGNACTRSDTCRADKACAGTSYSCNTPGACRSAAGATCDGAGGCSYPPAPSGTACGDQASTTCSAPDSCDGTGSCQPHHASTTTVCRAASGPCDRAETCDGAGSCPADAVQPVGTACGDQSSTTCSAPDSCDASGTCQPHHASTTTVCRAASGPCDRAETCDGAGSCPADAAQPVGTACGDQTSTTCSAPDSCDGTGTCQPRHASVSTICRAASGPCDRAETCDGAGSCPADALQPVGTACGDQTSSTCSAPDSCDASGTCQPRHASTTTVCRAASGPCDRAETCDGAGACPADTFLAAGTACGDQNSTTCSAPDSCDASGTCQPRHASASTICRAASGPCDRAETCDGAGSCPADALQPVGTACGDQTSTTCSAPDSCDASGTCQPHHASTTTVCRAASGPCDRAETCDGAGSCPADVVQPVGTACGDQSSTTCSAPDSCDASGTCQPHHASTTTVCRAASGPCDRAETCDGAGACPADTFLAAGTACGDQNSTTCSAPDSCDGTGTCQPRHASTTTICRAASGPCDRAETCDGAGSCPADALQPVGTACGDQTSSTCSAPDSCDASGTCQPRHASTTTVCRAASGPCDRAETCDGAGSCPADAVQPVGTACGDQTSSTCSAPDSCDASGTCQPHHASTTTVCRAATGPCDRAETCDGAGSCPADALQPVGTACGDQTSSTCSAPDSCDASGTCQPHHASTTTVCRAATGPCDRAETCDGAGACPADTFLAAGTACGDQSSTTCSAPDSCDASGTCQPHHASTTTVCRAASGPCDRAETCDGAGSCPTDGFQAAGTTCRVAAGACDVAEACTGSSAACPPDGYAAATTVCRASTGPCDLAESCTGATSTCPADAFAAATVVCRTTAGPCDLAESCTGASAACPADAFAASTIPCRASAGPCDVAETCTGNTSACPADAFLASTTVCRMSVGPCDLSESCSGSSAACPADAMASRGTACRAAANDCDAVETCDGTTVGCPADIAAADGTACEEASACITGGTCQATVCFGGTPALVFAPTDPTFSITERDVQVTVTHSGSGEPITLTGASIDPVGAFSITLEPPWPTIVAPSEAIHLTVRLTATEPGNHAATLNVQASHCADQPVALHGTVTAPVTPATPAPAREGGCSCGSGAGGPASLALLLLLLWRRRRHPPESQLADR